LVLNLVELFLVGEVFDELIDLQKRNSLMLLGLHPVVSLNYHLEQLCRASQQL